MDSVKEDKMSANPLVSLVLPTDSAQTPRRLRRFDAAKRGAKSNFGNVSVLLELYGVCFFLRAFPNVTDAIIRF